jgi:hypothetical protein
MAAGRPAANASMQGPAANASWLSSRTWARWSEALAQCRRPMSRATAVATVSSRFALRPLGRLPLAAPAAWIVATV